MHFKRTLCPSTPWRRSNITALSASEGRLLWRVDVTELVNTTGVSTSLTSLELADGGEVLLVRCGLRVGVWVGACRRRV